MFHPMPGFGPVTLPGRVQRRMSSSRMGVGRRLLSSINRATVPSGFLVGSDNWVSPAPCVCSRAVLKCRSELAGRHQSPPECPSPRASSISTKGGRESHGAHGSVISFFSRRSRGTAGLLSCLPATTATVRELRSQESGAAQKLTHALGSVTLLHISAGVEHWRRHIQARLRMYTGY